jgi:hypothetical protein
MTDEEVKEPRRAPLNDQGMERPRFLLDFPDDPQLERLIAAFEAGNFARVREDAGRLAETTADPAVKEAALELRRRIDPDPLAKYLLAISFVLLAVLTIWAYARGAP